MIFKMSPFRSVKMLATSFLCVLMFMEVIVGGFMPYGGGTNNGSPYGGGTDNGLNMNYYMMTCPWAEMVVRNSVYKALQADPTLSAALVRMHFHDCFIEGCDASVLIDSTNDNTAEKDSPGNLSLRGYEIIDDAKEQLEHQCPGVVSCADIVAMAARDAVYWSGGPMYDIPKGRKDGRRSKIEDTRNLPPPSFNDTELINTFGQRGFSIQDVVALSGAHTLGVARCASFKARLSNVDTTMDSEFAKILSKTCNSGDNAQQAFDSTANTFDNYYYYTLLRRNGLLFSDQQLHLSPKTKAIVTAYATNQQMFFYDFQQAMVKMGMLDIKQGSKGEVRQNCRRIN